MEHMEEDWKSVSQTDDNTTELLLTKYLNTCEENLFSIQE